MGAVGAWYDDETGGGNGQLGKAPKDSPQRLPPNLLLRGADSRQATTVISAFEDFQSSAVTQEDSCHCEGSQRFDVGHDVDHRWTPGCQRLGEGSRKFRGLFDTDADRTHVIGDAGEVRIAEGPQ